MISKIIRFSFCLLVLAASNLLAQLPAEPETVNVSFHKYQRGKPTCNTKEEPYCDQLRYATETIADLEEELEKVKNDPKLDPDKKELKIAAAELQLRTAFGARGTIYSRYKLYTRAIVDFDHALNDDYKGLENFRIARGDACFHLNRYNDAMEDYNTAIEGNPNLWRAYYGRGNVYYKDGNFDSAFENYDRAVYLNRRASEAYYARALIYIRRGDEFTARDNGFLAAEAYNAALDDLEFVLEIKGTRIDTFKMLAQVHQALGHELEAKKFLKKVEDMTPKPKTEK